MLIKSITVSNFLPFKDKTKIEFSVDSSKNVTIIKGNNGAGKTSLAQAFEWCLYGEVSFEDKKILNAEVRDNITPGTFQYAAVELEIEHEDVNYRIVRKQKYARRESGALEKPATPEFLITYKVDGETKQVALSDQKATINKLLSNELSRYFFFDGEHIKNMQSEIAHGKSQDFANAVKSILGLQHISTAMNHLKAPGTKNSVERTFRKQYSTEGDEVLERGTKKIASLENRNAELEERIQDAIADQHIAKDNVAKWQGLLDENKKSEEAMRAVRKAQGYVDAAESDYSDKLDNIFEIFKKNQYRFFSDRLILDSEAELEGCDLTSKGVPQVNDKTIKFLLERHECLCGTKFEDGDDVAQHLYELLSYVPPKDIGTYVSEFTHECALRRESESSLKNDISQSYSVYRNSSKKLEECKRTLRSAEDDLNGINNVDVDNLRKNLNGARFDQKESISKEANYRQEKTKNENEIDFLRKEIDSISVKNEKNRLLRTYIEYTDYIYDFLNNYYSKKEKATRDELGRVVNKFFQEMYDGDFTLELDENYGVTVRVADIDTTDEAWKTSSGQTLVIILSFILGILDIAKKNIESGDTLLRGATYPLVMDAPLSDFDKTRIETICSVLPKVAEQVIIIIKDTDGDLAEEHLARRIGKRYEIEKIRDFKSGIHESMID